MENYKKGDIVECIVTGIEKYGIFVSIENKFDGLIHISEVSNKFVADINKYVKLNDKIYAEILDIDNKNNHFNLSIKNLNYKSKKNKREKIIETVHGFDTLKSNLSVWIEENYKKSKKK